VESLFLLCKIYCAIFSGNSGPHCQLVNFDAERYVAELDGKGFSLYFLG